MIHRQSYILEGSAGRKFAADVHFKREQGKKPLVIFSHGFKGFKDWGHFNVAAEAFARAGFIFIKFNFSHNGTTPEHPRDFADLEAFGQNNYSKELDDLGAVMDFALNEESLREETDPEKLFLLGHSRGGAIALLKCAEDARAKKAVTWAAVSDTEKRVNPPELEEWKTQGVLYSENSRTKQRMPLYYQFREDFYKNTARLNLLKACSRISIPVLIIHGSADSSVPVQEARVLHQCIRHSELKIMEGADHTFGGKEPWKESRLPLQAEACVNASVAFLLS